MMSRPTLSKNPLAAERQRLIDDENRDANWKRWGPYLSERQWGTVREDYSHDGEAWSYFTHDHARSRCYRWGEDGLLGLTDRQGRFCFSIALWNGKDPYLKERLFGLTGPQGNHGEDVKEEYYYLESTPTHSYMKGLYKYPQAEFPYKKLVEENAKRSKTEREYELKDTGVFDQNRYFDVQIEYAKAGPDDLLIRIEIFNRGPEAATIDCLPTFWYRNTWSLGRTGEGYWPRPKMEKGEAGQILTEHSSLGRFQCFVDDQSQGGFPPLLFTENETNDQAVFGTPSEQPYVKDAFHRYVVNKKFGSVHPGQTGTKAAAHYHDEIPAGESVVYRARICPALNRRQGDVRSEDDSKEDLVCGCDFDAIFQQRIDEANEFYQPVLEAIPAAEDKAIARQAYAGLMWTKQFYFYSVKEWMEGDPNEPSPPASRHYGRNSEWMHLYNRDVISMPDKWEYPWYASWDLAFHMLPLAKIDPNFAKKQLLLFLREWYMHPSGQIPAYEFGFSDANPPVHAWSALRVFQISKEIEGKSDHKFLAKVFHKLLINFTWWINRKDGDGNHIFSGGFLGLDNIGVFDRSEDLPWGERLDQADATAWMAFYCTTMLSIALELAREDSSYEDVASKFFEHFVTIADAMNSMGGKGLWDEEDGFFYDHLHRNEQDIPLRIRSMVGLLPIAAAGVLDSDLVDQLPGFKKRMLWFLNNQKKLASQITYLEQRGSIPRLMLAIPSRERLEKILKYMLDEDEFLSPHGIRSMSRALLKDPFKLNMNGREFEVAYTSGESDSGLFGGNSNWRGPVWFPVNFLLIEALETYHHFYGDTFTIEYPTGSGIEMTLDQIACNLCDRLSGLLRQDPDKGRPS
ncbi:glucosidase, partial [Mariniblastus sp.]|nr:glucosidase [Mariniblastus sp.]